MHVRRGIREVKTFPQISSPVDAPQRQEMTAPVSLLGKTISSIAPARFAPSSSHCKGLFARRRSIRTCLFLSPLRTRYSKLMIYFRGGNTAAEGAGQIANLESRREPILPMLRSGVG